MSTEAALTIANVSHAYGATVVLREVSLTIGRGEVHCLLGPSGSGKSTLLRLVAGLEPLQEGAIEIAGIEVAGPRRVVPPEKRPIGFVFQDYALFPHLDVRRNVLFGMPHNAGAARTEAAEDLLARVDMADFATAMPHTLSGGQQQRVALARALAREPAVMLLDEPFSGLDERLREDVRGTTLEVLRAADVATLMVTHDPREALVAADRVSVIQAGRILQTGSPSEVYGQSVNREVADVFGPVNRLTGTVREGRVAVPWGEVPAPELDDGTEVEILVRPESFRIEPPAAKAVAEATIAAVSSEGALARLTLRFTDGREVQALDFASNARAVSEKVCVSLADNAAMMRRHN